MKTRGQGTSATKYKVALDHFTAWAGDRDLGEIRALEIEGFLADWHEGFVERYGKEPSPDTRRNTVTALRSFYAYLDRFDLLPGKNPMNKIDAVKVRRRVKPWLQPDELDKLAGAARTDAQAFAALWYALTGAREREGVTVRLADIDLTGRGRITIAGTKSDSAVRTIPLHPQLRPHLIRRIEQMKADGFGPETPILHTAHGTPIKQQQVGRWLAEMSDRAGIGKRVNQQMLRRSFGSILLNEGLRLEVVSRLLGHSSVKVTQDSYAELLNDRIEDEFYRAV